MKITKLEKQVLDTIVSSMDAEMGFSNIEAADVSADSGIVINVVKGVLGSLVKKGIIFINEDWGNIIYLTSRYEGLVSDWLKEGALVPPELVVKD
jgi:predicted transcriptional regulator